MVKTNDFNNAKYKVQKLTPIFNEYSFEDLSKVVFCLGVCKNNRAVLESIMALNWALCLHSRTGSKRIETYVCFTEFYNKISGILQATISDDVVVEDFGEVSIDVYGEKYSVIIGTGYSMVFACLQLLPFLASSLHKENELVTILSYSSNIIDFLKSANTSDGNTGARFVLPSEDLYNRVEILFEDFDYVNMLEISSILDSELIEKKHFVENNDRPIPLYNTSILLDLYDKWYGMLDEEERITFVNNALSNIALSLSKMERGTRCVFLCPVAYSKQSNPPELIKRFALSLFTNNGIIIAINADEYSDDDLKSTIGDILQKRDSNNLHFIELISRNDDKQYRGISVPLGTDIQFIVYNSWSNPEESFWGATSKDEEYHVCNALDVVYYLLFMDDVDELYKYLLYSKNMKDTQILCIGGDSSRFLMWKDADHLFEKGAIRYGIMNIEFDSENDYVVDYFRNKLRDFPIGRGDYILDNPFAWKITPKNNGFYEYIYKEHVGFGGLFRAFDNGCYFFFPYNSIFFHDTADFVEYKDIMGILDDIIQRIMTSCNDLICSCESINYSSIQVMMMPESYAKQIKTGEPLLKQERKYIKSDAYIQHGKIIIRYIPLTERIFKDLAETKNRETEVEVFSELLLPLNKFFPQFYSELLEKLDKLKHEKKEVSASSYELEYTWKIEQESYFRVENDAFLSVKKHIAQVCLSAGIQPGTYHGKDATSVVRKIQKELITDFENEVGQYNYLELYEEALSIYSTLIHEVLLHRKRYESIYDVKESCRDQIAKNIIHLREEAKHNSKVVCYLIETLLFLSQKGSKTISNEHVQYLLAYANWLVVLSENADMCYFTDDEAFVEVSSEYVIDVESKRTDHFKAGNELAKRMYDNPGYIERDSEADKEYFEKVQVAFEKDTGVPLAIFLSLVFYLETGGKIGGEIFYRGNVLCFYEEDIIKDFCSIQACPFEIAQTALASICIYTDNLKTKNGKTDFYLPIGEKEKRCDRYETKPVYKYDDMIIYSPSVLHNLKNYWENSLFEFHMPYEIGMENTKETLMNWKRVYEKKIVFDLQGIFTQSGFVARINFELKNLNKEKYPQNLGDYDVFAINADKKEIWIVECKVIEKVETFYEMYRQQNRFFNEDKLDEKFQRRIDYLKEHYSEVLSDLMIPVEKYEIKPFMCVNKVFISRYKEVAFPILSYQELVMEITKAPSSL